MQHQKRRRPAFLNLSLAENSICSCAAILLIVNLSCNQHIDNKKALNRIADTAIIYKNIPATDTIFAGERDTTILVEGNEAFIRGRIVANKAQPKYTISLLKGQSVNATLKPVKKGGNVRINQIQRPDGSFDGPFGDSLNYILKGNGKISFIIGENLMAGDPYTGEFILHITVK